MPHPFAPEATVVHRATSHICPQQNAVARATVGSCPIQIARCVDHHASGWSVPVVVVLAQEDVQDGLGPGIAFRGRGRQLIHGAALSNTRAGVRSPFGCGPIEIAMRVEHYPARRHGAVGQTLEAVEHFLLPLGGRGRSQHKNKEQQKRAAYQTGTLFVSHREISSVPGRGQRGFRR